MALAVDLRRCLLLLQLRATPGPAALRLAQRKAAFKAATVVIKVIGSSGEGSRPR